MTFSKSARRKISFKCSDFYIHCTVVNQRHLLALEVDAQLILIDELRGRETAAQHAIVALGTLGILLRAKSSGEIAEIRPFIKQLEALNFFMKAELKDDVLRLAGE